MKDRLKYLRHEAQKRVGIAYQRILAEFAHSDISFFHNFVPPPVGGGHQFLRALWNELSCMSFHLENNTISRSTFACLFNSHNFSAERLSKFARPSCLMAHRVDGPMSLWREKDIDDRISSLNRQFADVTIFQSNYSLQKNLEMGVKFREPHHVILNAADPGLFNRIARVPFSSNRKVSLITVSWSANLYKGKAVYEWLDKNLNWNLFEYTFLGNVQAEFKNIQVVPALPTSGVAEMLKRHDIYITASQNEACSNSLIEALACGLPAVYLVSGSHPEIVKDGGLSFNHPEEIPALIEKMVNNYHFYQDRIAIPDISQVALSYLSALKDRK